MSATRKSSVAHRATARATRGSASAASDPAPGRRIEAGNLALAHRARHDRGLARRVSRCFLFAA